MTEDAGDAAWDRALSPKDVIRLSPLVKQRRVRLSFERKLALLEARAAESPGAGLGGLPAASRTGLRGWSDEERKLWCWSAKECDHPDGPNADLVRRFERALQNLRPGSKAAGSSRPRRSGEGADKDSIIDDLRRQVVRLAEELRKRPPAAPTLRRR